MREYVSSASRRRDARLGRIRKLSLWITGGAAAASLGMGTAFAHAIPGHTTTTGGSVPASGTNGRAASTGGTATNGSATGGSTAGNTGAATQHGSAGNTDSPGQTGNARKTHHRHKLAPPASAPAAAPSTPAPAAPAPPVVSSGGS
jgi:hypothetical protein